MVHRVAQSDTTEATWQLLIRGSLVAQVIKASACNAGDTGSIPGLGRSLGEENGNPLQFSGLKNPMDGGVS